MIRTANALAVSTLLLMLSASPVQGATITFTGTVDASGLSGPLLFTISGIPVYAYNELDAGSATATSITGFSSLPGVTPSDVTSTFGDVERLSTTFTPSGCSPTPPPGATNCSTATNTYGEGDASPNSFDISLAGVGTILTGEIVSTSVTTDTDPLSPGFATATASGTILFTGGMAPYLGEVLSLTGGTGLVDVVFDTFDPLCLPGTDPCTFTYSGTITVVPEPATGLLLALGTVGIAAVRRRVRCAAPLRSRSM